MKRTWKLAEVCQEEASGGDVIDGCFRNAPKMEQAEELNQTKMEIRCYSTGQRIKIQGILDERWGESCRSHTSSSAAAAFTILFIK